MRSPPAPIIWWSAARSPRRPIRRQSPPRSLPTSPKRLEHDLEKARPALDAGWAAVFRKRSCSKNKDEEKHHGKRILGRACRRNGPGRYKSYVAANAEAFRKYGAKFLVRGGSFEAVAGKSRSRNVVLEFKDYATALACYRSPEYAKAMAFRDKSSVADIIVIEGYDGRQPTD